MIRQFLDQQPFVLITIIVYGQMAVALSLSLVIAGMLYARTQNAAWNEGLRAKYAEALVVEMTEGPDGDLLRRPFWPNDRAVLKSVLLDHLRSVAGPEREYLYRRYEDFGFVKQDLRQTGSLFWWRRLAAASDLVSLEQTGFAAEFYKLSRDPHELVSAFGHFALSGLSHELNRPFPVRSFPRAVLARQNVLGEILRNWARVHGPGVLLDQIARVDDVHLLEALVSATASVNSSEVAAAFAALLAGRHQYPPHLIADMIACLTRVGDPEWASVVRPYLGDHDEVVRLRAIECLVAVGDVDVLEHEMVRGDRSVLVRRAVERLAREVA